MTLIERLEEEGLVEEVARIRGLTPAGLRSRIRKAEADIAKAEELRRSGESELAAIGRCRGPISALRAARDRLPQSAAALLARHDALEKEAEAKPDVVLSARLDESRLAIRVVALGLGLIEENEHALAVRSELRDLAAARNLPQSQPKPPAARKTAAANGSRKGLSDRSQAVLEALKGGPRPSEEVRDEVAPGMTRGWGGIVYNLVHSGRIIEQDGQLALLPPAVED